MISYDFAFCTKFRYDVIKQNMLTHARDGINKVAEDFDASVLGTPKIDEDCVHVRMQCTEETSPVELLRTLKGWLSIYLQEQYPEIKEAYYGKNMFDRSFYRATSAASDQEIDDWKNQTPKHTKP
jgi:REP element-mobilizing transposase RayT